MSYKKDNIFALIINGTSPSVKVFENTSFLAIENIYPRAMVHILILPKGEYASYTEFGKLASNEEKLDLFDAINFVIEQYKLDDAGYRLVVNTGYFGGQSVPHFHIHLLGGEKLPEFGL